ncbi:MAG: hypothetical protein U0795_23100 [Pirellulales bacterium]
MFTFTESPTGKFTLIPMPDRFFEFPSSNSGGALLILNGFANNSATLLAEHHLGILIAATQAMASFGTGSGALEFYGVTDRTGSDEYNLQLSRQRAATALNVMKSAMGLADHLVAFSNGLGERLADEYYQKQDNTRSDGLRGVACYLWDSVNRATDPFFRLEIAFAAPPTGGDPARRALLGPLHLGRLKSSPRSPFA